VNKYLSEIFSEISPRNSLKRAITNNKNKSSIDRDAHLTKKMNSIKDSINKIKSESEEPSLIWSFDTKDLQKSMRDIVLKSENKVLMMYPQLKDIDPEVTMKLIDNKSRLIIQEDNLEDKESLELIKILLEKNVHINTKPLINTIIIISDETKSLVLFTDPKFEGLKIGLKHENTFSAIEGFEKAWKSSEDLNLEKLINS